MILVVGGTGRLGVRVVDRLCRRGLGVRVLSRGRTPLTGQLGDEVEVVRGDVRDPASLREPMAGVDAVVSCVQGFAGPGGITPESVDRDGNIHLIDAAESVGADVVMVSVMGASAGSPMELMRMKFAAEQRLRASSSGWTMIRPDAFAETWVDVLEQTAGRSGRPLVFGRGNNPISWVSVEDVAALVERAVVDPALRGRVLEICGPEPATLTRLAEMVMARHERAGQPRRVPRPLLHGMAYSVGRVRPAIGRQARAALAMDRLPTHQDAALRAEFPDLPCTPVSRVVAAPQT